MNLNLAELYQAANIVISAEDFALRQTAFDAAAKTLTDKHVVDCCRIYFGWWEKISDFDWFINAFHNDPRFSFVGNKREASALAGALLLNKLRDGNAFAGLVVLCAAVQGKRKPAIEGIDLSTFAIDFGNLAVEKVGAIGYRTNFTPLGKTAITKEKIAEDGSPLSMATSVMTAFTETHNASKAALSELQTVVTKMATDLAAAREQLAMLWWLIGGWSRQLKRSFTELGAPLAYISSGFDLADLSVKVCGPYASEALLAKAILPVKKTKKGISIGEIGDSPSLDDFPLLDVSKDAEAYPDLCPLSAALRKSAEIGKGDSWHASFEKSSHLAPSVLLLPQEVALQAFQERLLLGNL